MSSVPEGNRYAPPVAHVEDVTAADNELAGRGARFFASLIDGLITLAVMWVASIVTPWSPFRQHALLSPAPVNAIIVFAIFVVLQGYLLTTRGQTIGKTMLGLRIVRADGTQASFGRLVLLRYGVGALLHVVPGIGQIYGIVDALLIFRLSRKCLHDNIADTIVVKV